MVEVEKIEGRHGIVGRLFYDETAPNPQENSDTMGKVWTKGKYCDVNSRVFDSRAELEEELEAFDGVSAKMKLYSNRGMSGETLVIVIDRDTIIKEYGDDSAESWKKAQSYAEAEAKEWSQYYDGDVYGYIVEDENGDALDSCWGFYGLDYAIEEMKGIILWHEQEIDKLEWKKNEYHI